jgi:hypothetical protein
LASSRLFRGSELPRLLLLAAIVAAGWPLVWFYASAPAPAKKPAPALAALPPPPPPDPGPEFVAIQDKTAMSFRDTAAYAKLLERARSTPPAELAASSLRNLPYTELWDRPARYRGVPVHLEGTVRRALVHDELNPALAPKGKLYEAYLFTYDSQSNPYVLVFEEPPPGFPSGLDISERVRFDGYFLKLLAYMAGDTARAAPMLIGRLQWTPYQDGSEANPARNTLRWTMLALGLLTVYALVRWALHLRSKLVKPQRPAIGPRPSDAIAPEALSEWLQAPDEDPDDSDGPREDDER